VRCEREEFPDEVGYELPDLAAARSRAYAIMWQLTGPYSICDWSDSWVIILDENGVELDRISVRESTWSTFQR
jgi:hypothetical protein